MRKALSICLALALFGALTVGAATAPAGGKTAKITVGNNFFSPSSKTVKKGTKVKFKWTGGGAPHNVVKRKGPGGKFKSQTTSSAGVNFKKKFKKKGKYKMICTIHPSSMKLTLKVR